MSGVDLRQPGCLLKVCGVTTAQEVRAAADGGADLVGLWWQVRPSPQSPIAPHARNEKQVLDLAAAAPTTTQVCLVTFSDSPEQIATLLRSSGIRWVQLHALQTPAVVGRLRELVPAGTRLLKAVHVPIGSTRCLQAPFLGAYARAGVDAFVLDAVVDGTLGSTGHRLPGDAIYAFADRTPVPFLLAGGIGADTAAMTADVRAAAGFAGVDVDTAARDGAGVVSREAVAALRRSWPVTARAPLGAST